MHISYSHGRCREKQFILRLCFASCGRVVLIKCKEFITQSHLTCCVSCSLIGLASVQT